MNSQPLKRDTLFIPYMMSARPDPLRIYWSGDWATANHLWATLVELMADGTPSGRIASSWTTSQDQLTWEFSLKPNRKWSDGTPMTVDQIVESLKTSLRGTSHSDLSSAVKSIVENEDKIRIILNRQLPTLLIVLSYIDWAIFHPSSVNDTSNKPSLKKTTPGSGPFLLADEVSSDQPMNRVEFLRNSHFFLPSSLELERGALEHYATCDDLVKNQERALGFRSFGESISDSCRKNLSENFSIHQLQPTWVVSAHFTRGGIARLSEDERRSLLVFLHEKMAKEIPGFGVQRATGIIPPYLFGSLNESEFDAVLREIKSNIEPIGRSKKVSLNRKGITLVTMESWGTWKSFNWLKESLATFGLKVETKILSRTEYFQENGTKKFDDTYDLNFIPFGIGDPDPEGTWRMATEIFPENWISKAEVTEAFFETNRDHRATLYKQLARKLLMKAVYLPLRFDSPFVGVHKSLKINDVAPFRAGLTLYDFIKVSQ